jgi:hypothetical protein
MRMNSNKIKMNEFENNSFIFEKKGNEECRYYGNSQEPT